MKQENQGNGIEKLPASQEAVPQGQCEPQPLADHGPETVVDRQTALVAALMRAGTLSLTDWERAGLAAPFPADMVRQRRLKTRVEDYIPHIQISRRLCDVLGIGQWALIRLREWYDEPNQVVYGSYALVVRGVWVGDTVAGWPYIASNASMDYADALESCRGVALRRIAAKSLRCGDQVWAGDGPAPQQPPEPPTAAKQPPGVRPASQLTPERVTGLMRFGAHYASAGTDALAVWWRSLLPDERRALAEHKDRWKRTASAADCVLEQIDAESAGQPAS